eukprot:TCONS_00064272-protein
MLQKFFRRGRNSLNRSSLKEDSSGGGGSKPLFKKPKLFHSKSLDETALTEKQQSPKPMQSNSLGRSNGEPRSRAPLAGKDDSFETESGRKVHFKDVQSPNGTIDNMADDKLFDDGVMKAFEVGNLSIQEFLESPHTSPETTPDTTLIKKHKENGTHKPGILTKSKSLPTSPSKKVSLLDQAHAKAGFNTDRLPASPALRRQVQMRRSSTESDAKPKPSLRKSHRFSKSLEHLAQQVFGDEFETQLEKAVHEEPPKFPLANVEEDIIEPTSAPVAESSPAVSRNTSAKKEKPAIAKKPKMGPPVASKGLKREASIPPKEPVEGESVTSKVSVSPKSVPVIRRNLQRCHSASQHTEMRLTLNKAQPIAKSVDFPSPNAEDKQPEKLESWGNKMDLSSSRTSSLGGEGIGNSRALMDPVIEGVPMESPQKCVTGGNEPGKDRQRAKSVGCVGNPMTSNQLQLRYQDAKLIKSDSNAATCGSDLDLSESQTSILDLNFPPPPPVDHEEEVFHESPHKVVEDEIPFDWEVVSSDGGSADFQPDGSISDPLTDTLFSIVPLPEDPEQLKPALTRALSEMVSEIISARHKLNRILKAIEIHQQILKDQSKQINTQNQQISQLRFAQWEQNIALKSVKLRPKQPVQSKPRRPQSARTYRPQSREIAEINSTLDSLLHQCSTMQISPRSDNGDTTLKRSNQVKRSNTFPSREHVPTLKRIESTNDCLCTSPTK